MKISEMTNDQAAAALLRISGPASRLCDDDDMMKMLDEIRELKTGGVEVFRATARMIPKFVAFGLAKHKLDLYEIVGALMQEPTAKVGKLNFAQTVSALQESADDILQSFFPQSANVTRNRGGRSSAASRGTDGTDSTSSRIS